MRQSNSNRKILSLIYLLYSGDKVKSNASALSVIDWPEMTALIMKKGLAGHFYSMLYQNPTVAALIPADTMERLKSAARRVAAHNVFYETQCAAILKDLSAVKIESILLKGFSYMRDIYGDTSSRSMSDIDLLVHPADRIRAHEYLIDNGFSLFVIPSFRGSQEGFMRLADIIGETHYMKQTGALTASVDLHWKMRAEFPMNNYMDLDKFPWWEKTTTVDIGDTHARRLMPEMQFIHLALHFAIRHHYTGLRWFVELFLFLKAIGEQLDWEFVYQTASSSDCRKLLGVCLRLINDYLGDACPAAAGWQKFLPVRSLLPGEYRFYKSCLARDEKSRLAEYISMPLSPATITGRLKMIYYFLFDSEGVVFWQGTQTRVPKLLHPFYVLYIVARQLLRKRDA
jgi:hypothetical protein